MVDRLPCRDLRREALGCLICLALIGIARADRGKAAQQRDPAAPTRTVRDEALGYTIRLPAGARPLMKTKAAHAYGAPLPRGRELHVHLTPGAVADLAALQRLALTGGGAIEAKRPLRGGLQVIKKPQGLFQEVWVHRRGATQAITARCTGPSKKKRWLVEICGSLTVTR